MPEHALSEIVAASGLGLRARALDRQLIPVALVARSRQGSLADRRCVLDQRTLALAEPGRQLRRLELGADAGQLAPALVELAAQRLDALAGLRPDARRERLGHELLGLAAQALELLPGAQRGRVAIVQVAAPVEPRLLAAGARQLVAHARQLGRRLVVGLRARERIATGLAQGGQAGGQLRRARLAAPIGAPERVGSGREVLRGERRRPQEGGRGTAQQALLDLAPGRGVQPAQLVGVEGVEREIGAALEPGDLGERAVGELLLRLAAPGAARGPRAQMALDAHAPASGQHELELAVGVAVDGRRGVVLARGGREAVQHRGDERPQARLAGLVRAVDDEQVVLGEAVQLELGERPVGADANAVDPHGAASASSASASVSSISPSRPATYARRAAGSPESSPASTAGASSSSSASSDAARLAISSAAPSRCGWPRWRSRSSGGRRCSQRSSALSAPSASAISSAEPLRSSGSRRASASGERPRRSSRTTSSSPGGARLRRLEGDHRLAGQPGEAGGADVVEAQPLEAHRRERHELDLGPARGVDLDDERALGARLADVVRREAARVPGGRLRAHLLALVHVAERPVGVAAIEVLGRAGRIALARARRPVDLRVQHGDRGRAGRGRHQRGEVGALGRAGVPDRDDVPEHRAVGVR